MGSNRSMSRENKKKQLRSQMVSPSVSSPEDEDSEELIKKAHQKSVKRRVRIGAVIGILILATVGGCIYYDRYMSFADYELVWETDFNQGEPGEAAAGEGNFSGFADFADGVIKYTKDGASYLDSRGKAVWILSYEMKHPMITVNGDFAAIGDRQGNSIYICDKNGIQGQATTSLPVLELSVSAKGVTAAVEEDSKASYIYLYKKDGNPLDIYVKSLLSGDGYPVDVSLSPGGTQWITSFMYLEDGMIKNKVVFYNFGLGKNDPKRVVGVFMPQDLSDAMAGRVRFMDDSHAVIFTDKGLQFFSTRIETSPESTAQILLDENIRSISYTDQYAAVVTDNSEGSEPYRLHVYRADGSQVFETAFSFQYSGFDIDEDLVLLYNDNSCLVYNMAGTEKFKGSFDFPVSKVSAGNMPGTLLVMGPQKMQEIRLR